MISPKESLAYFQSRQNEMLNLLLSWVEIESPTTDKPAVDRFGEIVAAEIRKLQMPVEIEKQPVKGNHLVARWTGAGPRLLMVGHIDTVWNIGTLGKMPARVNGDKAAGPGIFDMKAGIVIGLYALQLLLQDKLNNSNITWILNSDEEEG